MKKLLIVLVLAMFIAACTTTTTDLKNTELPGDNAEGTSAGETTLDDGTDEANKRKACVVNTPLLGKATVCKDGCDYSTINDALTQDKPIVITDCETYEENIKVEKSFSLDCQNAVVQGDSSADVFEILLTENVKVENCEIIGGKIGFNVLETDNSEFTNNYVHNNKQGARVKLSENTVWRNNRFNENEDDGATFITVAINNIIEKNQFNNNGAAGLVVSSDDNKILDNEMHANGDIGLSLQGKRSTISDNSIKDNGGTGIKCTFVSDASFSNNDCLANAVACTQCSHDSCTETSC